MALTNGYFVSALLGAVCIVICLDYTRAQTTCTKQFTTVRSCFNQLNERDNRPEAANRRSLQRNFDNQKNAARSCLQRQGCTTDTADPKQLAIEHCLGTTKQLMQERINECMKKKGNADFNPEFDPSTKKAPSAIEERLDVRAAAEACEMEKGQEGIARDIKLCVAIDQKNKKPATTRGSSSALRFASRLNTYCKNKETCLSRFSGQCADDICACFEETRQASDVVGEYRSCLIFKFETANVESNDVDNAEKVLLQSAREWFPFCIPTDQDDSCDEEKGSIAKAADALALGDGANVKTLDLFKQLIGSDRSEQLNIVKTLAG